MWISDFHSSDFVHSRFFVLCGKINAMEMKKLFVFGILFAVFFIPSVASAATYYVATNGNDSSLGSQSSPFKTIQKAANLAQPGTTIHVAPGMYAENIYATANGTASQRITYISDTKWGAKIIPPANSLRETGFDNRGAYVTIDGFEVDGSVDPVSGQKWTVGINMAGTGNIVKNSVVHHIYNTGTANSNGGAGILLDSWYGFNDMQALNNMVHHVGPATGGTTLYHGIYQTATGSIKNNITYANTGGGVHLWHDAHHIDIVNNTSFGNGDGFIIGGGNYVHTTGPADYINVTNNIAYDNSGMGFDEEGENGSHNTFRSNLSFQNGTNWRLNTSAHTGDVTANPQFVNYIRTGGGDYHLQSTSPAIDKGSATYAPVTDFAGTPRPQGSGYDIGAYEYGGTGGPVVIYGRCGTTQNTCTAGTLNDTADSATQYLWQCIGSSNGGGTASCSLPRSDTPPNQSPSVSISSPTNGQPYATAPVSITIQVNASDSDGSIAKVEFFDSGLRLGEDVNSAGGWSWTVGAATAGSHTYRAIAYDDKGVASSPASVTITVGSVSPPPTTIPCTNPTINSNFTAPCPYFSTQSAASPVIFFQPSASPRMYIFNKLYIYKDGGWQPFTIGASKWLTSANASASGYTIPATITLTPGQSYYIASWDWRWNGSCWLGPDSTACGQGKWRLQNFKAE